MFPASLGKRADFSQPQEKAFIGWDIYLFFYQRSATGIRSIPDNTGMPKPINRIGRGSLDGAVSDAAATEKLFRQMSALRSSPEKLLQFVRRKFALAKKALERCAEIVEYVESNGVFRDFGHVTTKQFLIAELGLDGTYASRVILGLPYWRAIKRSIPEAKLSEAQIRDLRVGVNKLQIPDAQRIDHAVAIYRSLFRENKRVAAVRIRCYFRGGEKATPLKKGVLNDALSSDLADVFVAVARNPHCAEEIRKKAIRAYQSLGLGDAFPNPASEIEVVNIPAVVLEL